MQIEVKEEKSENLLGNLEMLTPLLDQCILNNMAQVLNSTAEFEKDEPQTNYM